MATIDYDEWQQECSDYLESILGINDLLDPDDPYDMSDFMETKFDEGISPKKCINEAFADDIAALEGDEYLREESLLADEEEL